MTNAEYHSANGISSSDFRLLEISPLHFHFKDRFKLEGKQFQIGSLVHKMVLEPETLNDEFVKEEFDGCRENKNSKKYKEAKAEFLKLHEGKEIVSVNDWEMAERMADNITCIAGGLLQNGSAEESFFVDDPIWKIKRKCRPDYYREDLKVVIDIKTTGDSSPYGFKKSIYDYRYHRQAAWYLDTLTMAGKDVEKFIFVVVEKSAPFMVRVYEIDSYSVEIGRMNYEKLLDEYRKFMDTGAAQIVETISLPDWAED